MGLFLLKRLLTLMATLLGASAVVFLVLEILPGNAAQMLMGPDASPEAVAALATKLGLDQPALQRYGDWIGGLLVGNMGESYAYSTPVLDLVLERLALTIPLALLAMLITAVLALLAGVYAASRHNRWGDVGVMALAQIGIAIPNFWFAILLILLFSVKLQWFSAGGFPGWTQASGGSPLEALKALLLPAIARRLEELPANRRALVVIEVENALEEQPLHSAAAVDVIWVHRDVLGEDLLKTVEALSIPEGALYTWVATESALSRKVRRVLLDTHGLSEEFVKAVGYWRLDGSTEE